MFGNFTCGPFRAIFPEADTLRERYKDRATFVMVYVREAHPLDDEVVESIEAHRFNPVRRLQWRNSRLQFGSVRRLIQTLEERTDNPWLGRVRESDDLAALRALSGDAEVAARGAAPSPALVDG